PTHQPSTGPESHHGWRIKFILSRLVIRTQTERSTTRGPGCFALYLIRRPGQWRQSRCSSLVALEASTPPLSPLFGSGDGNQANGKKLICRLHSKWACRATCHQARLVCHRVETKEFI